ncbi:TPA: hypothetical protein N0F65_003815 [Lagenidium giganteum]|uniref:BZIP domain-containing protein n=1 Tax=Lagenidium giganteum TaxID=4803 RepID=A0AAV2Z1Z2_9STRA|nr:TPA: hypothetical protein N0F65_003815 [Lagenidium giganteum]
MKVLTNPAVADLDLTLLLEDDTMSMNSANRLLAEDDAMLDYSFTPLDLAFADGTIELFDHPAPQTGLSLSAEHAGNADESSSGSSTSGGSPKFQQQQQPSARLIRRRAQIAQSARRFRSRKRTELMNLRHDVQTLTAQLKTLRRHHVILRRSSGEAAAAAAELAAAAKLRRREAEARNAELRRAVAMQDTFVGDLRSVFSSSPRFRREGMLRELVHTDTHFHQSLSTRRLDLLAVCSDDKTKLTLELVRHETKALRTTDTPDLRLHQLQSNDQIGSKHLSVFTFTKSHGLASVFWAATHAIHRNCARAAYLGAAQASPDKVAVEARWIFNTNLTETYGVMTWDFVDQDGLHPVAPSTDTKCEIVGALSVTVEKCEDGVERIVCRSDFTKLHTTCTPSAGAQNFSSMVRIGPQSCGEVVFNAMMNELMTPLQMHVF